MTHDNRQLFRGLDSHVRFNSVILVESIPSREVQTGTILRDYLNALVADTSPGFPVYAHACAGAHHFVDLLREVTVGMERGWRPILHIEAHGSATEGIHFKDDSSLSWQELCDFLTPLNERSGLSLIVAVAACFGFSLVDGMRVNKPAPCLMMVGPSDETDPGELMGRFRTMYSTMFRTQSPVQTMNAMLRDRLNEGGMMFLTAPHWFDLLLSKYLGDELTPSTIKAAALRMYQRARAEGSTHPIGYYKRLYRAELRPVLREWFETYFMYDRVPTSRNRFEHLWPALELKVQHALSR